MAGPDKGTSEASRLGDFFPDTAQGPEEQILEASQRGQLSWLLSHLSPRDEQVMRSRFGLTDGRTHTVAELVTEFGLSEGTIRRIEGLSLEKLQRVAARNGITKLHQL